MYLNNYLLSLIIWLPILGGLIILSINTKKSSTNIINWLSLIFSFLTLILCIPLIIFFDYNNAHMQFQESFTWLRISNINNVYYNLGVDGLSILLITLTSFTTLIIILASWNLIKIKIKQYMAIFLITCGLTNGVLCATDSMLYYVFWEALLIPTYLSIGIWGSKYKSYAAIKYFIYTFFSSIFLLIAILYIQKEISIFPAHFLINKDTYSIQNFIIWAAKSKKCIHLDKLHLITQLFIFIIFFIAFAVKIPMWPFHSWLPDAHSEAPAGGSVILAAIMLKLGIYGFLRFTIPMLSNIIEPIKYILIIISLIAIIYIGIIAAAQTDIKRLIAYSSISHMGLVTLGLFSIFMFKNNNLDITYAKLTLQGAIFQMIAHAFSSTGMFIGIGYLYSRIHTKEIANFSGIAKIMPIFSSFFLLFCMSNIGLPGTSGFVGEFIIIISVFQYSLLISFIAGLTIIISPIYTLWMYKRVFFGKILSNKIKNLSDLNKLEIFVFILITVPILLFGLYPKPILQLSATVSENIISLL